MFGLLLASCVDADSGESPQRGIQARQKVGITSPAQPGRESVPIFLLAGQSNMVGNVDEGLFESLLVELGQGSDDDLEARLVATLESWYTVALEGEAYSAEMAAFEAAGLIALRDEGLIDADFTAPLPGIMCSQGDMVAVPLEPNCGAVFGPELMLGHALAANGLTTTSFAKVAEGGTTLAVRWRPPSSGGEVGDLYLWMIDRIAALTEDPASIHPACVDNDCHWAGFIWFQGEQDAGGWDVPPGSEQQYQANLTNLIADVRGEVGTPDLPVVVVGIGGWARGLEFGQVIATAQQNVVDADERTRLVPTIDLSSYYHYDPAAQLIIGKRVADAVEELLGCEPDCGGTSSGGGSDTDSDSGSADGTSTDEAGGARATAGDDGDASATTPASSTASDGSSGEASAGASDEDASGCGCRHGGAPAGTAWAGLGLAALLQLRRRRPRA